MSVNITAASRRSSALVAIARNLTMTAMTLPAGTVTCVFTDIEGSTALVKRLGDRYGDVLRAHRRIVRDTFSPSGGVEIDTQGDSFFFAFPRAREAVAAAVEVQRAHAGAEWPDGVPVRVRIGLHTGEPTLGDEGYHGLDVVRAARICGVGRGGSVLLSETTRALVGSNVPEGVSVSPPDEQRLKGIDESELVYELRIEGVEVTPVPEPPAPEPSTPEAPDSRTTRAKTGRRLQGFASA
jgi:class 3 adenylate cyclase